MDIFKFCFVLMLRTEDKKFNLGKQETLDAE